MSLVEQIKNDMKEAMKTKDMERVSVLRLLISACLNKEKEKRAKLVKSGEEAEEKVSQLEKLTDDEAIGIVSGEIKKRKDAIEHFEKAGRAELAENEKKEQEILAQYMPEQLSEEDIRKMVKDKISELNASELKDIGKIMGAVMPALKGKADGDLVRDIVQKELTSR